MEAYKKTAPSHQDWMWESDPFEAAAKREAEKAKKESSKQAAADAASRGEVGIVNGKLNGAGKPLSKAWQEAKEVRLASKLREKIEATIRKAMSIFPSASTAPLDITEEDQDPDGQVLGGNMPKIDAAGLERELTTHGFRKGHARSAIAWLTSARTALSNQLLPLRQLQLGSSIRCSLLPPISRTAKQHSSTSCFTHRRRPTCPLQTSTSSESFVTASKAGAGGDALAIGWAVDKLSKQAGFPRHAVQSTFKRIAAAENAEGVEIVESGQGRVGARDVASTNGWVGFKRARAARVDIGRVTRCNLSFSTSIDEADKEEMESKRADERMAVEAVLGEERVVCPLGTRAAQCKGVRHHYRWT